jgi:hypothetical protein
MHKLCTGLQLKIGQCAGAARAVTTAGSLTKDTICATCTDGTYAPDGQTNCLPCTPVAGAATDATITCTTNGDSRVSKCLETKKHTAGTAGNHDTCTDACAATEWDMAGECTACTKVTWAAVGSVLGCSSATNSKFTAGTCANGYYEVSNTCTASADTCVACAAVANGVGLTCTSATTSQVTSCAAGYFKTDGVADVCTACTAVTNGVGLTCTSATNSQVTSCSTGNLFQSSDNADSNADSCVADCTACALYAKDNVCTAETPCAGTTDGGTTTRVQVTDTTNTADRTCTPCASGFWAAGNANCVAHSTCGCQADKTKRAAATAGTPTANVVCDACTSGSWGANLNNCAACAVVNGAASSATYTCTTNGNSRVSACAACDTTVKTVGEDDSTPDTCTATCAAGFWDNSKTCTACTAVANSKAGTTLTCTSATDSKVAACKTDFWKKTGAADSCMAVTKCDTSRPATADATATSDAVCQACADGSFGANSGTCTTCTAVAGAASGATYTCTSATDSRVSACAAATSVKAVGAAGAMDTCTAKPVVPAGGGGDEPAGSTPAGSGVSAANTATVGFASVVLAVVAAVGL